MKKIFVFILTFIIFIGILPTVSFAAKAADYFTDDAHLLKNDDEISAISDELTAIRKETGWGIIILTVDDEEMSVEESSKYIDKFHEEKDFRRNSILLFLNYATGKLKLVRYNDCLDICTEEASEYIFDKVLYFMNDAKWFESFLSYIDACRHIYAGDWESDKEEFEKNKDSGKKDDTPDITAENEVDLLCDDADILTDAQEVTLRDKLKEASKKTGVDVVVYTTYSCEGYADPNYCAEAFYDKSGYSKDGIILMLAMQYRDYAISPYGMCESFIGYTEQDTIMDNGPLTCFGNDNWLDGFMYYADNVVKVFDEHKIMTIESEGYATDNTHKISEANDKKLEKALKKASEDAGFDFVFLRVEYMGYTLNEIAVNFLLFNQFDDDAVVIVQNTALDEFAYAATGKCRTYLSDITKSVLDTELAGKEKSLEIVNTFTETFKEIYDKSLHLSTLEKSGFLTDDAKVLSDEENAMLALKLGTFPDDKDFELVMLTVDGTGCFTLDEVAQMFCDNNDFSKDNVIFCYDTQSDSYTSVLNGQCKKAISDKRVHLIVNYADDEFASKKYSDALNSVADGFYDVNIHNIINIFMNSSYGRVLNATTVFWSLLIGFVISLIIVLAMKAKLKSVRFQSNATAYEKQGSFNLSVRRDTFLYKHVSKTPRSHDSGGSSGGGGGGHSSGGGSHGGSHGKF